MFLKSSGNEAVDACRAVIGAEHRFAACCGEVFLKDNGSGIAEADAKTIRKTAEKLAAEMYRQAKPLRKLWLRWGRHIVK